MPRDFLAEVIRAYASSDPTTAEMQNWRNINAWGDQGLVTQDEASELHNWNYRQFVLENLVKEGVLNT